MPVIKTTALPLIEGVFILLVAFNTIRVNFVQF